VKTSSSKQCLAASTIINWLQPQHARSVASKQRLQSRYADSSFFNLHLHSTSSKCDNGISWTI